MLLENSSDVSKALNVTNTSIYLVSLLESNLVGKIESDFMECQQFIVELLFQDYHQDSYSSNLFVFEAYIIKHT